MITKFNDEYLEKVKSKYLCKSEVFRSPFQGSFASFPSWGLGTSKGSAWELTGNINRRLSPIRSFVTTGQDNDKYLEKVVSMYRLNTELFPSPFQGAFGEVH